MSKMCKTGEHDLEVVDDSFSHEFGTQIILYYECQICGATSEDDESIPDVEEYQD